MGQRFQVLVDNEKNIRVYHFQWLWGVFAIRRLGTAVKNYLKYNKNDYRKFEDYLKGSCYGKPNDINSFNRYFDEDFLSDNRALVGKERKFVTLKKLVRELDNNDGFFYLKIKEGKIIGYCFFTRESQYPLSAEKYMITKKWYLEQLNERADRTDRFDKTQIKEYQEGLKTFSKIAVIKPIQRITNENA